MVEIYQKHQGQTLHMAHSSIELGYEKVGLIMVYLKDEKDTLITESVKALPVGLVSIGLADKKDVKKILIYMASKGEEYYNHLQAWFLKKGLVLAVNHTLYLNRRALLHKMKKNAVKSMGGWSKSHIDHLQMMLAQNDENGI